MADSNVVLFDPTAPAGSQFRSPAVRQELQRIAPVNLPPGVIAASLIAVGAVTPTALAAGAVTAPALAAGAVTAPAIADGAVTTSAVADGAITLPKVGPGVMTSTDGSGNPVTTKTAVLTWAQYYALTAKDPNTLYFLTTFI